MELDLPDFCGTAGPFWRDGCECPPYRPLARAAMATEIGLVIVGRDGYGVSLEAVGDFLTGGPETPTTPAGGGTIVVIVDGGVVG